MSSLQSQQSKPIIIVLRWIAILPVAMTGVFIANTVVSFLHTFQHFQEVGSFDASDNAWAEFLKSFGGSYLFVYLGTAMAPKGRRVVSLVLAVLLGTASIVGIAYMVYVCLSQQRQITSAFWRATFDAVATLIAISLAVWQIRKKGILSEESQETSA
jgi:hypothetical protein